MAYTLLQAVNLVLRELRYIDTAGDLTSLTDSARQPAIDAVVRYWNEESRALYHDCGLVTPSFMVEGTVTLVAGQREYTLPTGIAEIRWPMVDQTNGNYIIEYPGGYTQMRSDQNIPNNFVGLPTRACINPTNNKMRMDYTPDASSGGRIYALLYMARVNLAGVSDSLPFDDNVVDAMVPAVAERWRRTQQDKFDAAAYKRARGEAARFLSKKPARAFW